MRRMLALCMAALACLVTAAPALGADTEVSISRTEVSTRLGDSFSFGSEVGNTGSTTLSGLVAHLNVVGLSSGIYVDPEDWSEERTRFLGPLAPGESTNIDWKVKAVTGGRVAIYVAVVPEQGAIGVSPAMQVRIADTKDLNSEGVLPLALGIPVLLGLVTLGVRRRRRAG